MTTKLNQTSKYWCVTCFVVDEPLVYNDELMTYLIYQPELTGTGTKHFQTYVELVRKSKAPKALFPKGCHMEPRKSTGIYASDYCTPGYKYGKTHNNKPTPPEKVGKTKLELGEVYGDSISHGTLSVVVQGTHTEVLVWKNDIESGMSLADVMFNNPAEALRHHAGLTKYYNTWHRVHRKKSELVLRPWQAELEERLMGPADTRKIIWCYDPAGSAGKTAFCKYMLANHTVFFSTNGKTNDIAHSWNGESIILFNYTRSVNDRVNYEVLEALKDGLISSPKYESHTKYMHGHPHMVCMSNALPDLTKMLAERWDIIQLSEPPEEPEEAIIKKIKI